MNLTQVKARQFQAGSRPQSAGITTAEIRNFKSIVHTQHRNEFPNKYNMRNFYPQDLEGVITQLITDKHGTEPRTKAKRRLMEHMKGELEKNSEPRPFYYADRNEIISMNEFFKAYKYSEIQRINTEKQLLRERLENNRKKIDEVCKSPPRSQSSSPKQKRSPMSSPQQSLNSTSENFFKLKKSRPTSSNQNPSQLTQETTLMQESEELMRVSGNLLKISPTRVSSLRTSDQTVKLQITEGVDLMPNTLKELDPQQKHFALSESNVAHQQKAVRTQNPLGDPEDGLNFQNAVIRTLRPRSASTMPRSSSQKGLNTQPKFTTKEIYRHLAFVTVMPRKLKKNLSAGQIEQHYVGIFRNPMALEKSIDRKSRMNSQSHMADSQADLISESLVPHYMKSTRSSRPLPRRSPDTSAIRPTSSGNIKGLLVSPTNRSVIQTTSKQEDEQYTKLVKKNIDANVKHIDLLLKQGKNMRRPIGETGRSQSSDRQREGVKKFNSELTNRIPLRKDVEKKYNIHTIVHRYRDLSNRMKQMKSVLGDKTQNSTTQIAYDNFKYVDYYHR